VENKNRLFRGLLEVADQVVAVIGLLQPSESHLGTGNVLLGVLEVLEQGVLVPINALLLVGIGVGVSLDLAGLASEESVESGPGLAGSAGLDGVALLAAGLEELGALCGVALGETHCDVCCMCGFEERKFVWIEGRENPL